MIIIDSGEIKIGSVILPGIFQKVEVEGEAKIDEIDVKGKSIKPKQATGYEDAKIKFVLLLKSDEDGTEYDKLLKIQSIFKKPSQEKPLVYEVFNRHINTRGISRVIFKSLTTSEDNKSDLLVVTCEFWEYIPITIQTKKQSSQTKKNQSQSELQTNLSKEYQAYLENRKQGTPESYLSKSKYTAAIDNDIPAMYSGGR